AHRDGRLSPSGTSRLQPGPCTPTLTSLSSVKGAPLLAHAEAPAGATGRWHRSPPLSGTRPSRSTGGRAVPSPTPGNRRIALAMGPAPPREGRPIWAAQGAKRARAARGVRGARSEYEGRRRLCRVSLWWTPPTAPWTPPIPATPDGCSRTGRRRCGGAPPSRCSPSGRCPMPEAAPHPLRLKLDPGNRTTGLALLTEPETSGRSAVPAGGGVWAGELPHRGPVVHGRLGARAAGRPPRRQRHTRYRPPRCANRRRAAAGGLPFSRESHLANTATWMRRLCRLAPVTALSQELVKFDTQALVDPELSRV